MGPTLLLPSLSAQELIVFCCENGRMLSTSALNVDESCKGSMALLAARGRLAVWTLCK